MALGTVEFYDPQDGFGYIRRDGWSEFVFHAEDVQGGDEVVEGQRVQFEEFWGYPGDQGEAIKIRPLPG